MFRSTLLLCLGVTFISHAADTPAAAKAAMLKGAAYMRSISANGGYLWRYSSDLKLVAGEVQASASTIWMQPPGTPAVGQAFLNAYEKTDAHQLLDHALAVGDALAQSQLESGGWDYRFDFANPHRWLRRVDTINNSPKDAGRRRNVSTFDDNNSQSALSFLLALGSHCTGRSPLERRILSARDYGLRKLLEAQYPNGAWPQRYDGQPKTAKNYPVLQARYPKAWSRVYQKQNYMHHYTFNDNSHRDCVLLALKAYRVTGRKEFLEAARRGGNFMLLAQMPAPQPVWAQQYNANMEPAWARKFEPASVTGGESVGVCQTLIDLYLELGEDKYLTALAPAIKWFKDSSISKDRWARFYELKTNKPLYFTKDYKLVYSDDDLPTHYGFQSSFGVKSMIRHYEKVKAVGREKYLSDQVRAPLTNKQRAARAEAMEKRVHAIVAAQDKQGRWLTKDELKTRGMKFGERIETRVFIENLQGLSDYLALLK